MTRRSPGPILFVATGVHGAVGGIASANRNVLAALRRVGEETGRPVRTLVLGEPGGPDEACRGFDGRKAAFALATLASLPTAGLAVFDHVNIARPILALPRRFRPPVVVCAHGSEASRRLRPSGAAVFRSADLVLTNSGFTLQRMRAHVGRFRGVACPLGLPPQFEVTGSPPAPGGGVVKLAAADGVTRALGDQVLLLVGRMDAGEQEKGHRELLDAMPDLLARRPGAQLVFAGGGSDLAGLRREAAASPAAASIFLTGLAPKELLETLYRKAFAFVMPSRQEGFGLVYLEAMNYAKPCLACREDGGADVVADGETGVLVSPAVERGELVGALDGLLGDPDRARRLGEAGWRRLVREFSSSAHQERVAGFVRPLLAARGIRRSAASDMAARVWNA
ncbi:MAG: glycosyltransferase family 4 protein [Pseudomonadota bacterium]